MQERVLRLRGVEWFPQQVDTTPLSGLFCGPRDVVNGAVWTRASSVQPLTQCKRCWWCRLVAVQLVTLPLERDAETGRWMGPGYFCSDECILAFALDSAVHHKERWSKVIENLMRKRRESGVQKELSRAPPWYLLAEYGGKLSAKEWRQERDQGTRLRETAVLRRDGVEMQLWLKEG